MKYSLILGLSLGSVSLVMGCGDSDPFSPQEEINQPGMEDLARAFVDSGLAAVVRETLEKPEATLTAEDLLSLTQLDASGRHIIHLTGIDSLKNLESLSLAYNPVQDLSPLTTLAKLVSLDLDNCQLRNISALAELTQLIHLNLDNNALTDIQALSPLRRLEELSLVDNLIADIAVLDDRLIVGGIVAPMVLLEQRPVVAEDLLERFFTDRHHPPAGVGASFLSIRRKDYPEQARPGRRSALKSPAKPG